MRLTCPHCHAPMEIEAATEDTSLRELLALLGRRPAVGGYLVPYIQLFKPRLQALRSSRALYLAGEVLALSDDDARLAAALVETVESLREKRQAESWRPLRNHAYLERVLETVTFRPAPAAPGPGRAPAGTSRTAQAIAAVERCPAPAGVSEALADTVRAGFIAWLRRSLEGVPAADVIDQVAADWMRDLATAREWGGDNIARLQAGFSQLGAKADRWPKVADVLGYVPRIGRR